MLRRWLANSRLLLILNEGLTLPRAIRNWAASRGAVRR